MGLVSVIIPTFNRRGAILRAVESVLEQNYPELELIVVDDGSTDDTKEVLAPFINSRKIAYIYQQNQGVSSARNLGLSVAGGNLIAFLDSDDFWLPEKCLKQVEFMKTNPELMICQTQEKWLRNGRLVNPKQKHKKKGGDIFEPSLHLCLISPSAVMIRRELFEIVGMFDARLTAAEDYDLWLRITARHQAGLIDEPLIVKTGGHQDQLSAIPGIDKFRVWSLVKLLINEELNRDKKQAVREVLAKKAELYGQGALKRERFVEGRTYLKLAKQILDDETLILKDLEELMAVS